MWLTFQGCMTSDTYFRQWSTVIVATTKVAFFSEKQDIINKYEKTSDEE